MILDNVMHFLINCMLHPVKNCHYCRGLMLMFPFQSMATSYVAETATSVENWSEVVPLITSSLCDLTCVTSSAQLDLRNSARSAGRFGGHFRTNKTKPHRGCIPPVPARVTDGIFRQLHGASFGVV